MQTINTSGIPNSMFKKILTSIFPTNLPFGNGNPAGLFVSFISARQFFGLVNRKMIENFKLNLFDINIDPFDAKIGFGDKPMILIKDIESYYAYCCTANFNGYKVYTPNMLSMVIAMVTSTYFESSFSNSQEKNFNGLLTTIYNMTFIFWSRIKIFPNLDKDAKFKRFIELFFETYKFILSQSNVKTSKNSITKIKNELLKEHINIFFTLFIFYQKMNKVLECEYIDIGELYNRLFYNDLEDPKLKPEIDNFTKNYRETVYNTSISTTENVVINLTLPVEKILKYVFLDGDSLQIARTVCASTYSKDTTNEYVQSFFKDDSRLEEFIQTISTHKIFKEGFMDGIADFVRIKFHNDIKYDVEEEEEMDDFFSTVENTEDLGMLQNIKIPRKLKDESGTIERLINFYITFLGGFGISRGDSLFFRIFRKDLIHNIVKKLNIIENKPGCLHFYGGSMYIYSKNLFYYKYTYENIKLGKDKFYLPFFANLENIQSNMFIVNLFNEGFFATLLQDMNPIEIKTYIRTKEIIDNFKGKYSQTISSWIIDEKSLVSNIYEDIDNLLGLKGNLIKEIKQNIQENDIVNLKNRMYSIDFWLVKNIYKYLIGQKSYLVKKYGMLALAGILATLKDTAFGLVLFLSYLAQKGISVEEIVLIIRMYCENLLITSDGDFFYIAEAIQQAMNDNIEILKIRTKTDDNITFLHFGYENRIEFRKTITNFRDPKQLTGEDILRFKAYTKNITYYNRRFILP